MEGFYNNILNVDLSKKEYWVEQIPDSILKALLGGRGMTFLFCRKGDIITLH